jgi:N-acetylglutamate synthase-like GNAT family acetyltransferase
MNKMDQIKKTEEFINQMHTPSRGARAGAVGLWKDLCFDSNEINDVELVEVVTSSDFEDLYNFRLSLDEDEDESQVRASINFFKTCREQLKARWYLLKTSDSELVGEIGVVPFYFETRCLGRIQNVEIASKYKGQGFGNQLLWLVEQEAIQMGISALCLKAKPDDWPVNWYVRRGYEVVGSW